MELSLSRDAERQLRKALRQAGAIETGGILMGEQIATGKFRVSRVSVDQRPGTHVTFRRSVAEHQQILDAYFEETGHDYRRFNYLGEWHSHPRFAVDPSLQDVRTMQAIVENEATITSAFMLIVRLRAWMFLEASASAFARGYPPSAVMLVR